MNIKHCMKTVSPYKASCLKILRVPAINVDHNIFEWWALNFMLGKRSWRYFDHREGRSHARLAQITFYNDALRYAIGYIWLFMSWRKKPMHVHPAKFRNRIESQAYKNVGKTHIVHISDWRVVIHAM